MSNYSWAFDFLPVVPKPENLLLDIGAYDLSDARFLVETFGSSVIAFEADPENFSQSLSNLQVMPHLIRNKIQVINKFLGSENRAIDFFAIDSNFYANKQASSRYEIDFSKKPKTDPDHGLLKAQKKLKIESVRYDALNLQVPHSIFMDVQGSELETLIGFGESLNRIQNVVLETSFRSSYAGSCNFLELDEYLTTFGFVYVSSNRYGKRFPRRMFSRKKFDFDVLYSRGRS
jgi:FkbM family methyltransferase